MGADQQLSVVALCCLGGISCPTVIFRLLTGQQSLVILGATESIEDNINRDMGLCLAFGGGLLLYIGTGVSVLP
eukprot:762715-Hanusia_phi.AAC.2